MKDLETVYKKIMKNGGKPYKDNFCIIGKHSCKDCPMFEFIDYTNSCWNDNKEIMETVRIEIRKRKLKKLLS